MTSYTERHLLRVPKPHWRWADSHAAEKSGVTLISSAHDLSPPEAFKEHFVSGRDVLCSLRARR